MAGETQTLSPQSIIKHPDILLSLGVVSVIMIMLLPLPRFLLDLLLAVNITVSVIILLVGLQVRRPIEFSSFPSVLLMVTLLRQPWQTFSPVTIFWRSATAFASSPLRSKSPRMHS
jgi:flagellar biosynthesis protein FlhA